MHLRGVVLKGLRLAALKKARQKGQLGRALARDTELIASLPGFKLRGLPPATYEVRVEPLDGSPPGLVGVWNFGGINQAVIPAKFPAQVDLQVTYHHLASSPGAATPLPLTGGDAVTVDFRPIASVARLDRFLRLPRAFEIDLGLNLEVTGALVEATFFYSVDGEQPGLIAAPRRDLGDRFRGKFIVELGGVEGHV